MGPYHIHDIEGGTTWSLLALSYVALLYTVQQGSQAEEKLVEIRTINITTVRLKLAICQTASPRQNFIRVNC